jgi:ribosome recycling factor
MLLQALRVSRRAPAALDHAYARCTAAAAAALPLPLPLAPPCPFRRALHACAPALAKGGREPSGKARATPASKAAAKAATAGARPAAAASEGEAEGGDDADAEHAAAERAAKDKSLPATLARQVASLKRELERIRGATPSAAMLDGVRVPAYGEHKALAELAQVVLRPPATLLVSPFDAALAGAISEAIREADLGLNPVDEGPGAPLRVPIPKASKESREAAVKLVSRAAEQAKVRVRRVRAGALGDLKKAAGLSEDDLRRETEAVERQAAAATAEVAKLADAKRVALEKL